MRPVPQAGCSQQPGAGTFMMAKSRLSGSVSAPPGRKQVRLEEASVGLGLAFAPFLSGSAALEGLECVPFERGRGGFVAGGHPESQRRWP